MAEFESIFAHTDVPEIGLTRAHLESMTVHGILVLSTLETNFPNGIEWFAYPDPFVGWNQQRVWVFAKPAERYMRLKKDIGLKKVGPQRFHVLLYVPSKKKLNPHRHKLRP